MFEHQDGFPFVIGGQANKVTDLHPPGIQIFQLWQIYLTNINPLLKVTHTQTLQGQIIEAGTNPSKISPPARGATVQHLFYCYHVNVRGGSAEHVRR